jgi:hypothetical protein
MDRLFDSKLKYLIPVLALALLGAAVLAYPETPRTSPFGEVKEENSVSVGVEAEAGSGQPDVKVNGQPVDLGTDGETTIATDEGTVTVSGSGTTSNQTGGKTVVTDENGEVNIQVESNSSGGDSSTTVRYRGGGKIETENDSRVRVRVEGEGSARVETD